MIDSNIKQLLLKQTNLNQHELKRYIHLIDQWSQCQFDQSIRCELHHIVPRSWGGSDEPNNLIRLPIKHHVVVHHVLARTGDIHMQNAFNIIVGNHAHLFKYNQTIKLVADSRRMIAEAKNKAVINLDTGEIFSSIKDASLSLGLGIGAVKDGIRECFRVGGFCWAHVSDLETNSREQLLARYNINKRKTRPVLEVDENKQFESLVAAANYYNLDVKVLCKAMKTGYKCKGHTFVYTSEPHQPRKVRNKDTGEVYQTSVCAGKAISVPHSQLINAINRKTRCRGYYWEYIDE